MPEVVNLRVRSLTLLVQIFLQTFGDKTSARELAIKCGVSVVPGTDGPVNTYEDAKAYIDQIGYPIIIKAAHGGGGRGMRVVESAKDLKSAFELASSEVQCCEATR